MKKLPGHGTKLPTNMGKPPNGSVFKRITAAELGPEFFRNCLRPGVFKEITHEDLVRISAEFRNKSESVG